LKRSFGVIFETRDESPGSGKGVHKFGLSNPGTSYNGN